MNASIVLRADVQFSEQPLESVQSTAKASQTPYLVYVFDATDRQCRKMARKTWKDETLASYIDQNYLACKLDVFAPETDVEWVQDYGVYEYPSVLFFNSEGILLGKADGFLAPETMQSMLEKHLRELRQKEEIRLWAAHYEETQFDQHEAMYLADNTLSADAGEEVGHLIDLQTSLADLQTDFPKELPAAEPAI
ncbi:MAG: thioredoxin fold domain-containing protein, partial [Bacteroidota bacterium]